MARASDSEKKGLHDTEPRKTITDDYPERPYGEAVSKEHRAVLTEAGFEVPKSAGSEVEVITA